VTGPWALLEIVLLGVGSMFWPLLLVIVQLALRTPRPMRILGWFSLRGAPRETPKKGSRTSAWVGRLVERGGPLGFAGGIVATILPAPLAIIAMTDIAQLGYSTGATLLVIVAFYLVMFTFVEVPMVGFVVSPEWSKAKVALFNAWLGRNLVRLAVWALTIFGTAEIVRGIGSALR